MGADILIRGPTGQRAIPVDALMTGAFETALDPAEIIEAVRIPRFSRNARWGYYKVARKTGEMAQAIGAVLHDPERAVLRAVMGATESRPIVFSDAAPLMGGSRLSADNLDVEIAAQALGAAGISDAVTRNLHIAALRRAINRAAQA
jgi:carbon-monoxide dehydrogenase medium subunit